MTASSGIDRSYVSTDVRAQDDLFTHVNGQWLASHQIPADRSSDGAFYALAEAAEQNVRIIVEETTNETDLASNAGKIGAFYRAFLDTERIEEVGLGVVREELDAIAVTESPAELAGLLGQLQRSGVGGLFGYYVDTDKRDSSKYVVTLGQSGLSLPDESYYHPGADGSDPHAEVRTAFVAHVTRVFELAGFDNASGRAAAVLELETAIAAHHWDVVRRRDAELTYNPHTFAEFAALADGFDANLWSVALTGDTESVAEVVVAEPNFFSGAAALFASAPLTQWQTWASWRLLRSRSPYLPAAFVDENFDFYGRTLTGAQELRARWKRGVAHVEEAIGFAVGELYTARHFPENSKERMRILVANLIAAYRKNISALEWMSPETRTRALDKLDKFTPKVGYPDTVRDYRALHADPTDLLGNVRRINNFEHDREFAKIGTPVDRDEWYMTPQTVNAYYNPGMNEIVFPAAILQPPFFFADADDAVNYGGIGAVIGHEIGHGFDDQGAKYDGDGNLLDWWTDSDRAEFGKRTAQLIGQYNEYSPSNVDDSHKVNGAFTVGENIGDLGGLSIALEAYDIALAGAPAPVLDGLTGDQRVFVSWATVWRGKSRPEATIQRLAVDPHSPAEFRCNGVVRNIDRFYGAFDVTESDALYLAPAERVRIW